MASPVQPGRDRPWLILVGAGAAAIAAWTWQQDDIVGPPPKVERDAAVAQRASGSLPGLFSTDDYPQAALRREEQGTVAFTLSINRRGRVDECVIATSSGSAALDSATCRVLQRRGRFTPARDASGKRVADTMSGRIRWQLPE